MAAGRLVVGATRGPLGAFSPMMLQWSPSCLFGATLCIDSLSADKVSIITRASEATEGASVLTLPEVQLPVALEVGRLHLGTLSLDGETALLRDLDLVAFARDDKLVVQTFSGQGPDLRWRLDGYVRMQVGANLDCIACKATYPIAAKQQPPQPPPKKQFMQCMKRERALQPA